MKKQLLKTRRESGTAGRFVASAFLLVSLSACGMLTEGGSARNSPPTDLTYATNPARYVYGSAITPNTPVTSRTVTRYSVTPALPIGLELDTTTGIIAGTPTAITADAVYTIQATNSYGSSFTKLQLAITDYPPTITYGGSTHLAYTVGTPVSTITPTLGGGATLACQSIPALPPGLSLSSQCVLTGTPTAAASTPTTYLVTAINSGGSAALSLEIAVIDLPPAFNYASSTFGLVRGQTVPGGTPTRTGGVIVSCSSSPSLPAGISLSNTCAITGNPTAIAASASYTITATNSGGSANRSITLAVTDVAPAIAYSPATVAFTKGKAITAVAPASTGGYIESCASAPALPAGLSLSTSCVLTGTPTALAGSAAYTITATNTAGTSNATLNIAVNDVAPTVSYSGSPFTYTQNTAITPPSVTTKGGAIVSCTSSPALPAGLSISNTTCAITGTPTAAAALATYTITATNSGGTGSTNIAIRVNSIPPILAFGGSPFSFEKNASIGTINPTNTGGAVTSCSSSPSLPPGLSVSADCSITGTPTAIAATASYSITGVNDKGSGSVSVSITVNDTRPSIAYVGSPYTFTKNSAITTLTASNSGGAITGCSSSPSLPAGLSINSTTCAISGTPTAITATASYTVTATNAGGNGTASIVITVNDVAPSISYAAGPFAYTKGSAIAALAASNSGGAITGCSSSPSLPAGLSVNSSTCEITGTPTAVSPAATYTITATNTGGSSATTISVTVNDAAPALSYTAAGAPFTFTKNSAITSKVPTSSGGTITGCSSSPGLPAGLSLALDCVISGTPTAVSATATYTITATNSGGSASVGVDITVNDIAPSISYAGSPFTYTKGSAITTLTASNSGGAITGCSSSPSLPAGLSINSTTCAISGTPTVVAGAAVYTITATNSGGSANASINVTVNDIAPSIAYAGSPYSFTKNVAITDRTATHAGGTPTGCSSAPALPAGLSINAATCTISGTPTAVTATATYTITATNSGGSDSTTVDITVNDAAPAIAYSGSSYSFTKNVVIATQTPTSSAGAITGCSSAPALPAGLSIDNTTCAISGTPTAITASAIYTITATNSGGSDDATLALVVNDAAPAIDYIPTSYNFTYTKGAVISALTPNNGGGAITSCSSTPALPSGLTLSNADCSMTGTPTVVAGATGYTITATNSGGSSSAVITITVNDAVPAIAYAGSPFALTRTSAITSQTPTNSGGTITGCSSSPALPAGLSLSSACVLSGTPTSLSTATAYTITATNTGGSATANITITVNDVAPTIAYAGSPFTYTVGVPISALSPTLGGGAVTSCSSSPALPAGLSINSTTCVISGTPTAVSGSTTYTLTAANTGGSDADSISITVNNGPPILSYSGSPLTYVKGTAISALNPTNTGGAITGCSSSPALPAGLALSTGCVLSGTPSVVVANATYTITATNAAGNDNATIDITVNDVAPSIGWSPGSVAYALRTAISTTNPSNSGGAITLCSVTPALPAGLTLNTSTCAITGTPTALSASAAYSVTASNTGGSSSATLNIQIKDQPRIAFYSDRAVDGSTNGTAPSSSNIWTATQDGVDHSILTANTASNLNSRHPSWNAAGTSIAHVSTRAQNGSNDGTATTAFNLFKMSATGTSPTPLTSNTNANLNHADEPPVFSPDGTKVAWASKADVSGADNGTASSSYNIFIMNVDGTGRTALTQNTNANYDARGPVFSPDGAFIYFYSRMQNGTPNGGLYDSQNIWRMNIDGTGKLMLTTETSATVRDNVTPAVSPDGNTVVFSSRARIITTEADSFNIWKMNYDGTSRTYLTSNIAASLDSKQPSFSPDGTEIVFASLMNISGSASSSYNVWKMDANGLNQAPLTTSTAAAKDSEYPQFSPDSAKIVFSSLMNVGASPSSSYNVFVINSDGTGSPTAVTSNTNAGLDSRLAPVNVWFAP